MGIEGPGSLPVNRMRHEQARRVRRVRALAVALPLFALAFYGIGGALKPGYSHFTHFISELNATGTPWARELGWFGFLPLGLLFAAFLWTAGPLAKVAGASRLGLWMLWSQPIALVGAMLVPCDAGCPIGGSLSQDLHDLLGLVTYPAGALGLFLLAFASGAKTWVRLYLAAAGLAWFVLFPLMLVPELAPVRGLLQRVTEVMLFGAVLVIGWRLVRDPRIGGG